MIEPPYHAQTPAELTDWPGWYEEVIEQLSGDGRIRERWRFAVTSESFLAVKLTNYTKEQRKSRRHRTWDMVAHWPRPQTRDYLPPVPNDVLDRVYQNARNAVVVYTPGRAPYRPLFAEQNTTAPEEDQ